MERRAWASLCCQWPEITWQVTSPQLDFDAYCQEGISPKMITEVMVGDLQRILTYPALGYQIPQEYLREL